VFNHTPDPALNAFTRGLAGLAPDAGGLDRDRLLFRAGAALAARRLRLWQAVAGVLAVLSVGLCAALLLRPPRVIEQVVYVPAPAPAVALPAQPGAPEPSFFPGRPEPERPLGPLVRAEPEGLWLRQQVLQFGVEALPPAPAWGGPDPAPVPLEHILGLPADSLDRVSTMHLSSRPKSGERKR
jgi:hypothetical protein